MGRFDAMSETEPPVLSIGAILGDSGAANMAWKRAINELSREVQASREGLTSPLRLNVIYHVDGRMVPNEFYGVRTGRFDRKTAHLAVQAAVALEPADDRRASLLALLEAAIMEAEAFARVKGISETGLPEIRTLVEGLKP
jgi:hypothetical protein